MESNMLEVGKMVRFKQFTHTAATCENITVGDVGVVCFISTNVSELNYYVVFHCKGGLADWFNADELEVVE